MTVSVYVPTPFRRATDGTARIELDAVDVRELLDALDRRYPGLQGLVRDGTGEVHHHVNVYVNGEEIASLQGQATRLGPGDEVSIIPALAGGRVPCS
jgi:molybdopterin converting factor small subunit